MSYEHIEIPDYLAGAMFPLLDWLFMNKPELANKLKEATSYIDIIAMLAAEREVAILLDGMYTPNELIRLVNIIGDKLKLGSSLILNLRGLG
jgi:hypothetical protein